MYCMECHRECKSDESGPEGVSSCHGARMLDGHDKWIVMAIRAMWSGDGMLHGMNPYPFGTGNPDPVQADLELLDAFNVERKFCDDDLSTIWAMIRG